MNFKASSSRTYSKHSRWGVCGKMVTRSTIAYVESHLQIPGSSDIHGLSFIYHSAIRYILCMTSWPSWMVPVTWDKASSFSGATFRSGHEMIPLTNFILQIFDRRAPSHGSRSALYYRRKVVRVGYNDHKA
jgi:hypothetical protein